jgi:acetyltransferase
MSVHNLDPIFNPRRIAVIGVTPNPQSVGGKILSNLVGGGFHGVVYPVSPTSEAVLGIPCYPDLRSLPKTPDLGIICSGAAQVPQFVRDCGEAGVGGLIINSAGFREIGQEGRELEALLQAEAKKFPDMRIIGPNCLGVISPHAGLNASFANGMPKAGNIAFISQSGALCSSVLDWAIEEKVGFSHVVSIGNTMDVDFGDLIDYFGEDEKTKSIILYAESISGVRQFMTAARAFARMKPIIAYKAGRFPQSAEVAASHTGAMASEDAVYDAAFQRVGMARVFDIGDIFDCAALLGRHKIPRGPRLAIITNAGGPGVMATDALIALNGELAQLSEDSMAKLNAALPPIWSHRNPVDVLGDARSKRFEKTVQVALADPNVDAVLVIVTPQAMTNSTSIAKVVGELASASSKPVLGAWLGGAGMREGLRVLSEAGVAAYSTPEQAVRAFMTLVEYSRNLDILYETPKDVPVDFPLDREHIRADFASLIALQTPTLPEDVSKMLLEAYGIPVTRPHPAANANDAVVLAGHIGYPVVMKIYSPDITHKSDVGGVALNLRDADMVWTAFEDMTSRARDMRPEALILGVSVQPMMDAKDGVELILGFKRDPTFGTVMLVGMGGTLAELFHDRALGFPPLNERLARRMLESLKIWPLLQGYRNQPRVHIERLIEMMIRLSYLAADFPEIEELDINPLIVTPKEAIALDARIILSAEPQSPTAKKYDHLALKPYPEEYVTTKSMEDGTELILRPIKPEDEPLWLDLLRSCSKDSIYQRFRYFFHWEAHEVATRYCFIDYEREIAIVAETEEDGKRKLVGVGRLIADPDHETVEYAVLVSDAWQERGLGSVLTDYCIGIAQTWGLKRIVAQTTSDNPRMIAVFSKRGFSVERDTSSALVEVVKELE